jgi:hypothetical protein
VSRAHPWGPTPEQFRPPVERSGPGGNATREMVARVPGLMQDGQDGRSDQRHGEDPVDEPSPARVAEQWSQGGAR